MYWLDKSPASPTGLHMVTQLATHILKLSIQDTYLLEKRQRWTMFWTLFVDTHCGLEKHLQENIIYVSFLSWKNVYKKHHYDVLETS